MILFTETWNSKVTNIDIKNYEHFSCPRPKSNLKAKRHSGGLIIYYKAKYHNCIELVNINSKGIVWFKLKRTYFGTENDLYFCTCYIPPESSNVYKNAISPLYEYDFFDQLNIDISNYSNLGDIYVTGDLNARTGQRSDIIDNINLQRYVTMPQDDNHMQDIPLRTSHDHVCNSFGNKLLSLCKENDLCIVNGRLEEGKFTCHNLNRNRLGSSVVDYLISNFNNFPCMSKMQVHDLTEFSDHCPIEFSLNFDNFIMYKADNLTYEKIIWDDIDPQLFSNTLNYNKHHFDNLSHNLLSNNIDINTCVESFSELIYDISFNTNGHTFNSNPIHKPIKKAAWFNNECKNRKSLFFNSKRLYKNNPTDHNKTLFLSTRSDFSKAKRKAKYSY